MPGERRFPQFRPIGNDRFASNPLPEIKSSQPFLESVMKKTFRVVLIGAALLLGGHESSFGAVLTNVPMQGTMVMPEITYSEADGALHVKVDPTIPQLTPLLVSNPNDGFNPSDPWFAALDPSRQGLSFSKRYGFVMGPTTDPMPADAAIWIRKLSGSPGLGFYRAHAMSLPYKWEPIFGTEGTTNALYWSATMFHPCVTAPPGTNGFSAQFEAYLVNTVTGEEVADSGTGPFELNWTNVSDGRPQLAIGNKIVIAWPESTGNWVLEAADNEAANNWTGVTNSPAMVDGKPTVIMEAGEGRKIFRMRKLP